MSLKTNTFLNDLAERFFQETIHQFGGPGSKFVRLEVIDSPARDAIFNSFRAHVVYQQKGLNYGSGLMEVKYYDSRMYASCWGIMAVWMSVELWFCQVVMPAFRWVGKLRVHEVVPNLFAFQAEILDTSSSTKCAFLWENMDAYKKCDAATLLDYQHLSMMAQKIAKFHAFSFDVRVKRPQFFKRQAPNFNPYSLSRPVVEILERCLQPLLEMPTTSGHSSFIDASHRLRTMLDDFENHLSKPFAHPDSNVCRLVCHQHYTQQNVAFRHDLGLKKLTDMRIINWQWSGFASLGVDLVFLLAVEGCNPVQYFDSLLNEYLSTLKTSITATNVCVPSRDQILEEVKISMPLALHILGKRVLSSTQRLPSGELTYPPKVWSEQRITETYKLMVIFGLI